MDPVREKALQDYRKKLLEHAEVEGRLKESKYKLLLCFIIECLMNNGLCTLHSARAAEGPYQAI